MIINKIDVSGKIVSNPKKDVSKITFFLKQEIRKDIFFNVEVLAVKEAAETFEETGLKKGDNILLLNGMLYQKNNKLKLKVEKRSQIINMELRKETLDLGIEQFA